MNRIFIQSVRPVNYQLKKGLKTSVIRAAKNDSSTIDSFKLPSQTSINEWEFKYDFIPKVSEPKVPPVSPEAIKQDIAHEKKIDVEREMFNKEGATSVKVEANDAKVIHGGESVIDEPEFIQDRGSDPIKVENFKGTNSSKPTKPANRDQYLQTSINPNINQSDVNNLSESTIDHKQSDVKPSKVVDDLEEDNMQHAGQQKLEDTKSSGNGVYITLGLFGLGAGSYYIYNNNGDKSEQK